jgi:hypothetical protein
MKRNIKNLKNGIPDESDDPYLADKIKLITKKKTLLTR